MAFLLKQKTKNMKVQEFIDVKCNELTEYCKERGLKSLDNLVISSENVDYLNTIYQGVTTEIRALNGQISLLKKYITRDRGNYQSVLKDYGRSRKPAALEKIPFHVAKSMHKELIIFKARNIKINSKNNKKITEKIKVLSDKVNTLSIIYRQLDNLIYLLHIEVEKKAVKRKKSSVASNSINQVTWFTTTSTTTNW